MTIGDRIWYRQTCVGGYGFRRDVPAVYIGETPHRTLIEVGKPDGSFVRIAVKPANVRPRRQEAP